MAAETSALRNKARRVKDLALTRAENILSHPENYPKQVVEDTFQTVLKNAVPRTQEITGEEGEAIKLTFDQAFNGTPSQTT